MRFRLRTLLIALALGLTGGGFATGLTRNMNPAAEPITTIEHSKLFANLFEQTPRGMSLSISAPVPELETDTDDEFWTDG